MITNAYNTPMSQRRTPLLVLGFFLTQMLFAGVHALEDIEVAHVCAHHDSSSFDQTVAAELEAHLDCHYCQLASSNAATFVATTTFHVDLNNSAADLISQTAAHLAVLLCDRPLRGPPALV